MRHAFERELHQGQIQRVELTRDCSIVAVVGDGMAGTPGVAAKMFGALSSAGVNIRAIAQGASERNISAMIDARDLTRALRAVHASFYLSAHTISIGVIGPGLVGSALVEQLDVAGGAAARDLEPRSPAPRRHGVAADALANGASRITATGRRALADGESPQTSRPSSAHVDADHLPHSVIIDCTASAEVAANYPAWLAQRHPRRHAEQARQQRRADSARRDQRGAAPDRRALPLRGHRWRRLAGRSRRCAICARPATTSGASRASSRARCRTSSTSGTAGSRFPRCFSTRDGRALPSPTRATTSRAWTSAAS